jgi:hypothetical protein
MLPLAEDFHPGKCVELEIVSGGIAAPEKRDDGEEAGAGEKGCARDRTFEQVRVDQFGIDPIRLIPDARGRKRRAILFDRRIRIGKSAP